MFQEKKRFTKISHKGIGIWQNLGEAIKTLSSVFLCARVEFKDLYPIYIEREDGMKFFRDCNGEYGIKPDNIIGTMGFTYTFDRLCNDPRCKGIFEPKYIPDLDTDEAFSYFSEYRNNAKILKECFGDKIDIFHKNKKGIKK